MTTPTHVAVRADVSGIVARIMAGEAFSCLLLDDKEQRAAALETIVDHFSDDGTRLAWVGNPLRSPLTIERFLMQIAGPEVDLRVERGPAELAQIITQPVGDESRLLIIVQQPETINAETRELLGEMVGHSGGRPVQVQFLFAGSSVFTPPPVVTAPPVEFPLALSVPEPAEPKPRRGDAIPLLLLLLVVTIGVVCSFPAAQHELFRVPELAPPAAAVVPPAVAAVVPPAPDPVTDTATLRREFDAFLAQRASSLPPLSDGQKNSLFNEFLTHHHRE